MTKNVDTLKWVQIATVYGSFGECGDTDVPGMIRFKTLFDQFNVYSIFNLPKCIAKKGLPPKIATLQFVVGIGNFLVSGRS